MEYTCGTREPRKWGACEKLEYFLRKPRVYLSILFLLLIIFIGGGWLVSSKFLQLFEDVEDLQQMNRVELEYLSNINWTSQFIPTKYSTPNNKLANLVASRSSGYWILASESAQLISIEKKECGENCTEKIYLNQTQLNEIGRFLDACFIYDSCNTTGWRVSKGFSIICEWIVHMEKSGFQFCIDNDQNINSAFINTYIMYYDVLNLLYAAQDIFKQEKK